MIKILFTILVFLLLYLFLDKLYYKEPLKNRKIIRYEDDKNEFIEIDDLSDYKKKKRKKNKSKLLKDSIVNKCFCGDELSGGFDKYLNVVKRIVYKVVGSIKGELWYTEADLISEIPLISSKGVYVNNMCVLRSYRGLGIGSKLIRELISVCRESEKLYIILQINDLSLLTFYEKFGFIEYGNYQGNKKYLVLYL